MDPNESYCLLCGEPAILKHDHYPGYQEPVTFRIYFCTSCNSSFALPRVDTTLLYDQIYKNGDRVPGYNRYWLYARYIKKFPDPLKYLADTSEVYWGIREALSIYNKNKASLKILEIGSGLGYLTYSLIKSNYDVTGLDISKSAVNRANETFGNHFISADLFDFSQKHRETFDVVILTEVIEHLNNPLDFARSAVAMLKPGGLAIITSPNKSLFPDDIIWATDLPPVHYWWLSEESMKQMAKVLDMEIGFISFVDFYRKRPRFFGLGSHRGGRLPRPFLNQKGELLDKAIQTKSSLKPYFQTMSVRIPVLNKISGLMTQYILRLSGQLRKILDKDLIACGERGSVFCAVIKKRP